MASLRERVGATLTPAEIRRKYEALSKRKRKNTDDFIAAGRGDERPSEYLRKNDPLSVEARRIFDAMHDLEQEARKYAGPDYQLVIDQGQLGASALAPMLTPQQRVLLRGCDPIRKRCCRAHRMSA